MPTPTPPLTLIQLAHAGLVRPLRTLPTRPAPLATGFSGLDALLGGGLPCSTLTVIAGEPSSGVGTLALQMAGHINQSGRMVAWLDLLHSFDPAAARCARLDLTRLLLVRPTALPEAMSIAYDVLCEGSAGLMLLDAGGISLPEANLRLLVNAVARSRAVLVCLSEPTVGVPLAELRLSVKRLRWETYDALALRTRVTIEAGRSAVGCSVELVLSVEEAGPCWSAR